MSPYPPFLTLIILLSAGSPALAHVSAGGIVDSYSGLLHPFTEPLHIITLLGLGFLLTQQDKSTPPVGWLAFCIASLSGLIAYSLGLTPSVSPVLFPLAILIGMLVAIRPALPRRFCILLSIIAGFTLGLDSIGETSGPGKLVITIFSTTTGLGIALLMVIGWGDYFTRDWQKIGIRVVGSWIAASALLVFALGLRPV
jgi:hydrogenase/urease accessory protein HupE